MSTTLRKTLALAIILGAFSAGSTAHAVEKYYMIVFAYEGTPPSVRASHTFASFIKATQPKAGEKDKPRIETHTISWLPASLDVRILNPPEKGVNLDLPGTLKLAAAQKAAVTAWGPFEIRKELFEQALVQIKRLNDGTVAYKAFDARFRPNVASNCIHAVSDVGAGPMLDTGKAFGAPASLMVLQHLAPGINEPDKVHRDLAAAIGLDAKSIAFRDEVLIVAKEKK